MLNVQVTKRGVQIALGLLWLLDGALQLQPKMFTSAFANQVIAPAAQGQPSIVSGPMHFGIHLILSNPALFDACFALIQLSIGAAIMWKKTTKYGLYASVLWGLSVWFSGEGLAGMLSGHSTLLMGAPGAALLYAVLSLAVLPSKTSKDKKASYPVYWIAIVWAVLWIGGGIFQLLPGQDSASGLGNMISNMGDGAPGWLYSIDHGLGSAISHFDKSARESSMNMNSHPAVYKSGGSVTSMHMLGPSFSDGYWFVFLLAIVQIIIGIGIFYKGKRRQVAVLSGMMLSFIFWFIGQNLGGFYTGLATDTNSGPLFILLGLSVISCFELDQNLARLFKRIEHLLTGQPEHNVSNPQPESI